MEMFLIRHDLFSVVDGCEANPSPIDAAKLAAWKLKDAKAKSDLILHCDNR